MANNRTVENNGKDKKKTGGVGIQFKMLAVILPTVILIVNAKLITKIPRSSTIGLVRPNV